MRAGRSDISSGGMVWMAALQMHGTGTPLGDPIEVGAACAVAEDDHCPPGALALGATKAAAGSY